MLSGQTILVVEAEFLIALDIQRMLEGLGAGQTLFARSAEEAHDLAPHWPTLGLAIVELRSDDQPSATLVERLRVAGIPTVLVSVNSRFRRGHPDFPGAPVIVKPVAEQELGDAVRAALAAS